MSNTRTLVGLAALTLSTILTPLTAFGQGKPHHKPVPVDPLAGISDYKIPIIGKLIKDGNRPIGFNRDKKGIFHLTALGEKGDTLHFWGTQPLPDDNELLFLPGKDSHPTSQTVTENKSEQKSPETTPDPVDKLKELREKKDINLPLLHEIDLRKEKGVSWKYTNGSSGAGTDNTVEVVTTTQQGDTMIYRCGYTIKNGVAHCHVDQVEQIHSDGNYRTVTFTTAEGKGLKAEYFNVNGHWVNAGIQPDSTLQRLIKKPNFSNKL